MPNLSSMDGLFFPRPHHLFTLCTDEVPGRVTDPERTARALLGYYFLDAIHGGLPGAWLQRGVTMALAAGEDPSHRARLNRRMIAAFSRGTAWSSTLFLLTSKGLAKLVRGSADPEKFQEFIQFSEQSRSVVEYLWGERSPGEWKVALLAFLKDRRAKTHPEASFRLHFGFGFSPLLEGWRQWVLDQGIGIHQPPPPRVQEALINRVIPVIRNRKGKRGDRILAIRELGIQGYLMGADVLIDLLRNGDDIPSEEVVWALTMISGMAWGDNPDPWAAWWDRLMIAEMLPQPGGAEPQTPAQSDGAPSSC
jgi:hypothetical protein